MAQTSFASYLFVLRAQEKAFVKAAEKALTLDAQGALPPALAEVYYRERDHLYLAQVAAVNVVKQRVLDVHPALVSLVPDATLAPDLPRTAPLRLPPDQSSAPALAVRLPANANTGLGSPAAVAVPPTVLVIAAIVGIIALMALLGGVAVLANSIATAVSRTREIKAFDDVLSRRSSYITLCAAQGGSPDACIAQANAAFPTPAEGLPPAEPTPWYLRGSTYALIGGAALTAYLFSLYKRHVGPEPTRFSAGIAGSFALPRQLKSHELSTSTYGLEV